MDRRLLLAGLAAAPLARPALAQERFPVRPLRLVVPFAPGGPTDVFGRRFADRFARVLGQTVVVENRAGAGGMVGAQEVARARPDGTTLLFHASSSAVTSPLAYRRPLYHPLRDFAQIAIVGIVPFVLAVGPQTGARSMAELIARLRERPGALSFGSSGVGTSNHLASALFLARAGNLQAEHIPYRGSGPAIQDLVAGTVAFMVDTFSTLAGLYQDRRVGILAALHERRLTAAPEIPTAAEQGLRDAESGTFNALAAPAGTPAEVIATLHEAIRRTMAEEAFRRELETLSIEPVADSDPAHMTRFIQAEMDKWRPIIQATGVSIE
ncbi:MAG TPA: tripartite tricarboxylate transporter substrate binding protein [Acetobacteraceae bacterium]|nr:tripartite tricarboxylate transporter substrate binding protein [Acetobacteraceae bacterium]